MTEHLTDPSTPETEQPGGARLKQHSRRNAALGSTGLACALGGALLGAAAFTAVPGGSPAAGASSGQLSTSSTKMPLVTGSLCASTRNTATAADTEIACENFGRSSYALMRSRDQRQQLFGTAAGSLSRERSGRGRHVVVPGAGTPAIKPPALSPTGPGLPGTGGKAKTPSRVCVSTPKAPKGTPKLPGGVSVSLSGGGGGVTVKVSGKGVKLCGTAPKKAPKLPKAPSSPTLPSSVPGVSSGVSSVVSDVSGLGGSVGL